MPTSACSNKYHTIIQTRMDGTGETYIWQLLCEQCQAIYPGAVEVLES